MTLSLQLIFSTPSTLYPSSTLLLLFWRLHLRQAIQSPGKKWNKFQFLKYKAGLVDQGYFSGRCWSRTLQLWGLLQETGAWKQNSPLTWWFTPVVPAFRRLRQDDDQSKASLSSIVKLHLRNVKGAVLFGFCAWLVPMEVKRIVPSSQALMAWQKGDGSWVFSHTLFLPPPYWDVLYIVKHTGLSLPENTSILESSLMLSYLQ